MCTLDVTYGFLGCFTVAHAQSVETLIVHVIKDLI